MDRINYSIQCMYTACQCSAMPRDDTYHMEFDSLSFFNVNRLWEYIPNEDDRLSKCGGKQQLKCYQKLNILCNFWIDTIIAILYFQIKSTVKTVATKIYISNL